MTGQLDRPAPSVVLATTADGRASVLRLLGDHDLSTAPGLRQDLAELYGTPLVVLDFAQCSFVDSTVLGVIASATRTLAEGGGRLVGLRAEGIVQNALRVTGLDDLLLADITAVLDSDVLYLLQEG